METLTIRHDVSNRVDIPLLRKVVDHAISSDNWFQSTWVLDLNDMTRAFEGLPERIRTSACNTAMCVAGFTAIEFGGWRTFGSEIDVVHPETGHVERVFKVAQYMLGLSEHEAYVLFNSHNQAHHLTRIVEEIVAGWHEYCAVAPSMCIREARDAADRLSDTSTDA